MQTLSRKNKINLADYPYKKDVENRLVMAELTDFEVSVLAEIIHHSLKISIDTFAKELDIDKETLIKTLDKLSRTKLFKYDSSSIHVDKEMRKFYESQLEKFDENFEPDLEYIQSLLSNIPIHVLPTWYAIPRGSDNIFLSLVEKYLHTPDIYLQYIEEQQFDDPRIKKIIHDLNHAPEFRIASSELIKKYGFTKKEFEELILLLEYHFICCMKYEHGDGEWHETVTFFHEWLDYLKAVHEGSLASIKDVKNIKFDDSNDFVFISDMETILKACNLKRLNKKELKKLIEASSASFEHLLSKVMELELLSLSQGSYRLTDKGALWLKKSMIDRAGYLANASLISLESTPVISKLFIPRNIRLIEKAVLKRVANRKDWFLLEDFIAGFTTPIGDQKAITLKKKGKKWQYVLPSFSQEELDFIKAIFTERFYEMGIITLGTYKGKTCFKLTPFGRILLS